MKLLSWNGIDELYHCIIWVRTKQLKNWLSYSTRTNKQTITIFCLKRLHFRLYLLSFITYFNRNVFGFRTSYFYYIKSNRWVLFT